MKAPRTILYHCVFKYGLKEPVAMFLDEEDAKAYHANPEVYGNGRRRVCFSETPIEVEQPYSVNDRAMNLLRTIVLGADEEIGIALEEAQQLLEELTKEKNDKDTIKGGSRSRKEASKRTVGGEIANRPEA